MKEELIRDILALEWEMFQQVSNVGGTAPCQEDPKTFRIMRSSQAAVWTEPMLESYRKDLLAARDEGRNLMTEKYARMMERTCPEEYEKLKDRLPPLPEETRRLAERITELLVRFAEEAAVRYPAVSGGGRPIRSAEDTPWSTSIETYSLGELCTYGQETLRMIWEHYSRCRAAGHNLYEITLENTVRQYGYDSLRQAEELAAQREKTV